jgi:hypothetical protein
MSSKEQQPGEAEKNIEIWKVKKLIKRLESARGNGTSMISLIIRTSSLGLPSLAEYLALTLNRSAEGSDFSRGQDVG